MTRRLNKLKRMSKKILNIKKLQVIIMVILSILNKHQSDSKIKIKTLLLIYLNLNLKIQIENQVKFNV